jgi:hypothetical protein
MPYAYGSLPEIALNPFQRGDFMNTLPWLALVMVALPSMALAQTEKTSVTPMTEKRGGKPYFEASQSVTEQGTVVRVDSKTRNLTLRMAEGDTLVIKASNRVKNFDQIKERDVVKVAYTQTVNITVTDAGTPEVPQDTSSAQADSGPKPSGLTHYRATITALDKAKGVASLKGFDGADFTITPRDPARLDQVNVGDLVTISYTEAVAASVQKVKPKK